MLCLLHSSRSNKTVIRPTIKDKNDNLSDVDRRIALATAEVKGFEHLLLNPLEEYFTEHVCNGLLYVRFIFYLIISRTLILTIPNVTTHRGRKIGYVKRTMMVTAGLMYYNYTQHSAIPALSTVGTRKSPSEE